MYKQGIMRGLIHEEGIMKGRPDVQGRHYETDWFGESVCVWKGGEDAVGGQIKDGFIHEDGNIKVCVQTIGSQ